MNNTTVKNRRTIGAKEAVAGAVRARFEESSGYPPKPAAMSASGKRNTVPFNEVHWQAEQLGRLTRDRETLREMKAILERVYGRRRA